MSRTLELRCKCGNVEGRVSNASPKTVNRVICYCDDCQAFLHHLGRSDLMDGQGGSDIVQIAPASLAFVRGTEHITGARLTEKGLYRWYASCCKTPLGNTLTPGIPFVGIVAQVFPSERDEVFGKPVGTFLGKFATGPVPAESVTTNARHILRLIKLLLSWRFGKKTWPHPFFDQKTRAPLRNVTTLTRAERDALRPLCGPRSSP